MAAEMDQIALPVPELATQVGFCRPLVDGDAVRDRGLAPAIAPPPAARRLALRKLARMVGVAPRRAVDVAIDGFGRHPVLHFLQFHPPRDLLRGPFAGKTIHWIVF
jgi:hypothetical protein